MNILASATDLALSGTAHSRFTLAPSDPTASFSTTTEALGPNQKLFLVLRGLGTEKPPGVLYALYLALPAGQEPSAEDFRQIGTINFYGAVPQNSGFYSFDISRTAKALQDQGLLDATITLIPLGTPTAGAQPIISRAEFVLQSLPRPSPR